MRSPDDTRLRHWLYLAFIWAVAVIPVVYFHNGIVTEYYFSKAIWGNLFIALPILVFWFLNLQQGRFVLPTARTALPLALLCGWGVFSLTWAENPYKGLEYIGRVGMASVAYFGALYFIRTERQIRGFLFLAIWTMVAVSLYGFLQWGEVFYLPKDQYGEADPSTTIGLTNFVVEYFMPLMLTAPMLFLLDRRRWVRSLLLFASVCILLYLIVSRNRAAMLGFLTEMTLLIGVVVWLVLRHRDRFRVNPRWAIAGVLAIVLGLGLLLGGTTVGQRVSVRFVEMFEPTALEKEQELSASEVLVARLSKDASTRFRMHTWYQSINFMFPAAPVAGVGLANLEVEFPEFYTDFLEGMTLRNNTRVVRAHNEYVQLLVDLGIIGFLLFFWMIGHLLRNMAQSLQLARNRDELLLWLAIHLGFVGVAVECFFAFPLHIPTSAVFIFVMLAISEAWRRLMLERHAGAKEGSTGWLVAQVDSPGRAVAGWLIFAAGVGLTLYQTQFAYRALVGEVRSKEARVLKRFQRWDESYVLLSDAIRHYPWMEGYYYDRAVVMMQRGQMREALRDLQVTSELVPNYGMGRRQIGQLAAQLGMTELAVDEFRHSMLIYKSQRAELTELIARTALRGQRPDLAVETLRETMDEHGVVNVTLLRLRADAYAMLGQMDEARGMLEALREAGDWGPAVQLRYAGLLAEGGEVTRAESMVRDVLAGRSGDPEAWLTLGHVMVRKGDSAEARAALERALALDPAVRQRLKADRNLRRDAELAVWLESL